MRKFLALALLLIALAGSGSFFARTADAAPAVSPAFADATNDYKAGKYQAALIKFEKCKAQFPSNILVHYYEALCYQGLAQFDMAKSEFQYVIDNGPDSLKGQASAGIKQLDSAHSTPNTIARGAPGVALFNRPAEPGRAMTVLEFLDPDLCVKCRAFAPCFYQASCRLPGMIFGRIIIDQGDPRIGLYNPKKEHPYLVILDGTMPVQKVLWKGILPNDSEKIIRHIKKYQMVDHVYTPPSDPVENKQNNPNNAPTYNPNTRENIIPMGPQ